MPRRAKMDETETVHADETTRSANGISETQLKGFVSEYESEEAAISEIMENARVACQPHKDQQKAIINEAAEAGIEKKAFRAKMRERGLRRKADRVTDSLSERQRDIFAEISLKLGDLAESLGPLGQAALDAHQAQAAAH